MSGRTVFVTGATGYLGASLVPLLLARVHGALAAIVDSPPTGVAVVDVPGIRAA